MKEVPAVIYHPLQLIFFLVGIIEVISIAFRPISLSAPGCLEMCSAERASCTR